MSVWEQCLEYFISVLKIEYPQPTRVASEGCQNATLKLHNYQNGKPKSSYIYVWYSTINIFIASFYSTFCSAENAITFLYTTCEL